MEQHVIQKAWLKQFSSKGKVKKVICKCLTAEELDPLLIATITDFQTSEQEKSDNDLIENRGVQVLHSLRKNKLSSKEIPISKKDRLALYKFVALHLSRNFRDISDVQTSGLSFEIAKKALFDDSFEFLLRLEEVWVVKTPKGGEPLVLSDQPVIKMDGQFAIPISPDTCVFINDSNVGIHHIAPEIDWSKEVNNMSFRNSNNFFICNPKEHPNFQELKARSKSVRVEKKSHKLKIV